jgi:hypothetical protein
VINLAQFGYSRAVWVIRPGQWWLRPDGLSVCTEEEAIREIQELVGGDEEDHEDPRPAA